VLTQGLDGQRREMDSAASLLSLRLRQLNPFLIERMDHLQHTDYTQIQDCVYPAQAQKKLETALAAGSAKSY
jgi:hypothetical protein